MASGLTRNLPLLQLIMQNRTLVLYAKDGAVYRWPQCTNIRQATRELRWTNIRGEHRTMALAFIAAWHTIEETVAMATFHLTDGTTIDNVTVYSEVHTQSVLDREGKGPLYTVFTNGGHLYVPVDTVASIERTPGRHEHAWYDLPMAAGMWAADGADTGA
jgi:hypothetical protein